MCKYYSELFNCCNDCRLQLSNDDKKIRYICDYYGREQYCERFKQGEVEKKEKSELFDKVVFELNTIKSINKLIEDLKKDKEKAIKKAAQVYYWSNYKCPDKEVQAEVDRLHQKDILINERIKEEKENNVY
jgi:hypothetical protein